MLPDNNNGLHPQQPQPPHKRTKKKENILSPNNEKNSCLSIIQITLLYATDQSMPSRSKTTQRTHPPLNLGTENMRFRLS